MELSNVEERFCMRFTERHRRAMFDPSDPIHDARDFLVPSSLCKLLQLAGVTDYLNRKSGARRLLRLSRRTETFGLIRS